jgi:hypothetical protein
MRSLDASGEDEVCESREDEPAELLLLRDDLDEDLVCFLLLMAFFLRTPFPRTSLIIDPDAELRQSDDDLSAELIAT